jgi:two-component system response regulator DegU
VTIPSTQKSIQVLIADDHPVVRNGIRDELAKHADLALVGEATDGDQALALARSLKPDVVLLDINMPGKRAVQVVRELGESKGGPRVLVLSAYGDLEYVFEMLRAGVDGYLLKDEDPDRISEGIRAVTDGQTWLSAAIESKIVDQSIGKIRQPNLSPREQEVLRLIARGLSNEDIAEQLTISEGTVKNHVSNLYTKLGVRSRAQAVAWAWENGKV